MVDIGYIIIYIEILGRKASCFKFNLNVSCIHTRIITELLQELAYAIISAHFFPILHHFSSVLLSQERFSTLLSFLYLVISFAVFL